jgi:NADPH-dependent 2,4-dienoyl-CoA reductase/sulfur reductase-like enzyme
MNHPYDYLIIGAGMTADAAAKAIHEREPGARIGIVGEERHPPYERPPLSKALWKGNKTVEAIDLGTKTAATLHLGRRIVTLDRAARRVCDDRGDTYSYRRLLLATGASPRRLPFRGARAIEFRTLDDYLTLRRYADAGAHIAVVGGGFIGGELAAALADRGCRVTLLFPGSTLGAGRLPPALGAFLNEEYRAHGVVVRPNARVTGGRCGEDGVSLSLADGSTVEADVVVAGLGVTPNTHLAEQAGLAIADGIAVDDRLRTSDPEIFAAGDVANFPCAALGTRLRIEHENAAISMGHHAGRVMTGDDAPYTTLPFFYSDLFDLGYEAVGVLDDRLTWVEDWIEPFREGVVYYLDGGRVRGVLPWNVWGQVEAARELIAEPGPHDAERLRGRLPKLV